MNDGKRLSVGLSAVEGRRRGKTLVRRCPGHFPGRFPGRKIKSKPAPFMNQTHRVRHPKAFKHFEAPPLSGTRLLACVTDSHRSTLTRPKMPTPTKVNKSVPDSGVGAGGEFP